MWLLLLLLKRVCWMMLLLLLLLTMQGHTGVVSVLTTLMNLAANAARGTESPPAFVGHFIPSLVYVLSAACIVTGVRVEVLPRNGDVSPTKTTTL